MYSIDGVDFSNRAPEVSRPIPHWRELLFFGRNPEAAVPIPRGMKNAQRIVALGIIPLLAIGCEGGDADPVDVDATPPRVLTGVYTCSIETIDGYSYCGGPVYTTDLEGQGLTMSLTQTGIVLEAGMWGKILSGSLQSDGQVSLVYRDTSCTYCSPTRPFIIDFTGVGGPHQVTNIFIRMHQNSIDECEKTYRGTCSTN